MKRWAYAVSVVLLSSSLACASWLDDFTSIFQNEGIDQAVEEALKEGATPDVVVENGLQLEGLNPSNLIKALYCAGAKGQDIKEAALDAELSQLVITAGYQQSIAECGDRVADAQPFTPVATGTSFVRPAPGGGSDSVSPSTF